MKRVLVITFLISISLNLMAESSGSEAFQIQLLLDENSNLSPSVINEISHLSKDLDYNQLYLLERINKKKSGVPFALNFFLGFGIGSYYQGDKTGGNIGLLGDLIAIGGWGYLWYSIYRDSMTLASDAYSYGYTESSNSYEPEASKYVSIILVTAGVSLFSKLYQWVRPFSYTKDYNKKLNRALNPMFSLNPVINNDGEPGLFLGASIKL